MTALGRILTVRVWTPHRIQGGAERFFALRFRCEASRVFRRLLFVRRSYDERYKEQVFA